MSHTWLQIDRERVDAGKLCRAARRVEPGSLVVLPTDTNYAFACRLGDAKAIARLRRLRDLGESHQFTLLLADFKSMGKYAVVDNDYFRLLKSLVPGAYTFILPATKEVPKAFAHKKRKTIGLRIPDDAVLRAFLQELGEPMVACSLKPPNEDRALESLEENRMWLGKVAGLVIDAGTTSGGETTMLDLSNGTGIEVQRQGKGPTDFLED